MTTDIRQADLESDRELIIECLSKWLTAESNDARFDWLYRDNPAGPARVWIASDPEADTTVGVGAAFPRRMFIDGEDALGWVLGDFCINPNYRSLGPALKLQRACLSVVEADGPSFCYDFPNTGMMAVYKRLRVKPLGLMVRLARPLRVDRKVKETIDVPGLTQALSAAGNLALEVRDAIAVASTPIAVETHEGACGDEFTALAEACGPGLGIGVQRSAAYLNWRFLRSTYCTHELLTARREGSLVGYAVYTVEGDEAMLVDLFGVEEPEVLGGLVHALARRARKRGATTLSAPVFEAHRWRALLRKLSFWPRESTPVTLHSAEGSPVRSLSDPGEWFLFHGDRDS